jgi:hypothetical protein
MNNYIDVNNKILGFDSTQTALIPAGAVLIPDTYTSDQYPFLTLVNGVINFNANAYNASVIADQLANCKEEAKFLLSETDWSEIPSVSDTSNAMHLLNIEDFISYRVQVRALRVNPVANPTFPTMPTPQWSS